jgi:hypothetical protein
LIFREEGVTGVIIDVDTHWEAVSYDELLTPVDPAVRAAFLGGTSAATYARMGDPLPVPAVVR